MLESRSQRARSSKWAAFCAPVIIALALALVACGGDDTAEPIEATESAPAPEASLGMQEVIAQGDAICAEFNAALSGLEASEASPAMQISQRSDLYQGMIERLRGLDTDAPGFDDVLVAGRELVEASTEAGTAATSGDAIATSSAEAELESALSGFESAATEFGLTECGGEAGPVEGDYSAAGEGAPIAPDGETGVGEVSEPPAEPSPQVVQPEPGEPPAGGGPPEGGTGVPDTPGRGADGGEAGSNTGGFSPE